MVAPNWHQKVFDLARQRFEELPVPKRSRAMLLFIRYGQIHCRTFFSDSRDADELPSAHYQMWKRIDDLRDTAAEAYAVASLTLSSSPSTPQCSVIDVQGAERGDPYESRWFQRISFDPESGNIAGHECWPCELTRRPNALSPFQVAGSGDPAEPDAAPNGGPAQRLGSSAVGGGPPTVS
jgi:hypothetical protein